MSDVLYRPYSKDSDLSWLSFSATLLVYTSFLIFAEFDLTDRAAASFVLILGIYLSFKPKVFLHPGNLVFANYLLYLLLPYSLFSIYRVFNIEYLLPWGLINDWSRLSNEALYHFELTFTLFFLSTTFLYSKIVKEQPFLDKPGNINTYEVSKLGVVLLFGFIFVGCVLFLSLTGGASAWMTNYTETYTKGKAGVGLLNFALIVFAHFLAFVAGWMKWRDRQSFPAWMWAGVIITLFACMFLQGIKSRIPLLLFFFLAPQLISAKLHLSKAIAYFFLLMLLFSVGMYFRSGGFYNTPQLALEYLQSYFNTIFLHDLLMNNPPPAESTGSMLRGLNKLQELFGDKLPREKYDLSVSLTQIYYPNDWYNDNATQQWPIESDFYTTFSQPIFWIIPILIYAVIIVTIGRRAVGGAPFFLFLYGAELVRIMTIFRSGFITYDIFLLIPFYFTIFAVCKLLFFRRVSYRSLCLRQMTVNE